MTKKDIRSIWLQELEREGPPPFKRRANASAPNAPGAFWDPSVALRRPHAQDVLARPGRYQNYQSLSQSRRVQLVPPMRASVPQVRAPVPPLSAPYSSKGLDWLDGSTAFPGDSVSDDAPAGMLTEHLWWYGRMSSNADSDPLGPTIRVQYIQHVGYKLFDWETYQSDFVHWANWFYPNRIAVPYQMSLQSGPFPYYGSGPGWGSVDSSLSQNETFEWPFVLDMAAAPFQAFVITFSWPEWYTQIGHDPPPVAISVLVEAQAYPGYFMKYQTGYNGNVPGSIFVSDWFLLSSELPLTFRMFRAQPKFWVPGPETNGMIEKIWDTNHPVPYTPLRLWIFISSNEDTLVYDGMSHQIDVYVAGMLGHHK